MSFHVVNVEDDKPLRGILSAAFRAVVPEINLHQFVTADEALPYIQENKQDIDLYVLDIRLPGQMNGVQLAQKIREIECNGYVVLTSAYTPPSRDVLAEIHGEYYPKPWHIMDLTEKLSNYRIAKGSTAIASSQAPAAEPAALLPGLPATPAPAISTSPPVAPAPGATVLPAVAPSPASPPADPPGPQPATPAPAAPVLPAVVPSPPPPPAAPSGPQPPAPAAATPSGPDKPPDPAPTVPVPPLTGQPDSPDDVNSRTV